MSTSKINLSKKPPQKSSSKTIVSKPSEKQKDQDEYFATNSLFIYGLLPLIPKEERKSVEKWMKKFYTMNSSDRDRQTRNDYVWFLLVQLESGVVTLPFIHSPPEGRLNPVAKSVEKIVYEEILQAANNRASYIEDLEISKQNERNANGNQVTRYVKPEDFLANQPYPRFGFIAYGSCFSNQSS